MIDRLLFLLLGQRIHSWGSRNRALARSGVAAVLIVPIVLFLPTVAAAALAAAVVVLAGTRIHDVVTPWFNEPDMDGVV